MLCARAPRYFLLHIFTTESRSHGEITEPSYEARIDPRLGRLCGLVSSRFARVVCKEELTHLLSLFSA